MIRSDKAAKKKTVKKKSEKKEAVKPAVPAFIKPKADEKKQKSSKRPRNKGR